MNLSVVLVSQIKFSHLFYPVRNNPKTRQLQILPDTSCHDIAESETLKTLPHSII